MCGNLDNLSEKWAETSTELTAIATITKEHFFTVVLLVTDLARLLLQLRPAFTGYRGGNDLPQLSPFVHSCHGREERG